jgi:hypothetical protein
MPQFYIDSTDFSTATAIYSDALCTTPAQDGYYASCGVVRQQLNGTLLPYTECIDCKGYEKPTLLLLDEYPGAAAAYSLRQISAYYDGAAVRVRRASDNFEQDIGFDANGDLDTSALATFCAGTDGFVVRWYDQSGNGDDLVQSSTAQQPQIVASGSVILENGKPKVQGALGKALDFPALLTGSYKIYSVGRVETNCVFIGTNSTADYLLIGQSGSSSTGMFANVSSVSVRKNSAAYTLTNRGTLYTDFSAQHALSVEATFSFVGDYTRLGYGNNGVFPMMSQQALIIYPSTSTHAATDIEYAINAYHNVYWDGSQPSLLDTYPNAAIAYDLTAINSAYTGPLVRVRRASDNAEQDIYAKQDGSLNVSGLESFCSGTDGFVTTWYDQSGNSNDAVQTSTSLQPQIVASGSVQLENSEPCMNVTNGQGFALNSSVGASSDKYSFIVHSVDASDTIWSFFGDPTLVDAIPLAQDGNTGTGLESAGFSPLRTIYKNGTALTVVNRDELHDAYSLAGKVLSTMDFAGSAGIGVLLNRGGGRDYSGKIQSIIIYTSNQSTDRVGIEASLNAIHNIYWDGTRMSLLDSYPFASGAYSVRALNSNYTGPVVRVRRSSDDVEKDIKALWDGELDVATLESFCSGTDGFVSVWYDQSGNGKDMSQAVTSNQPSIVSSGSVRRNSLGNVGVIFSSSTSQGLGSSLSITGGANFMIVGDGWSLARADIWGDGVGWTNGKVVRWEGSGTLVTMNPFAYTDLSSPQLDPTILQVNRYGGTGFIRANGAQSSEYTMNDHAINNLSINQGTFVYRAVVSEFAVWEVSAPFDSVSLESDLNAYHTIY